MNILSQVGYRLIGNIADRKESELKRKAEEARKNNNRMEAETYEKAAGKWQRQGSRRTTSTAPISHCFTFLLLLYTLLRLWSVNWANVCASAAIDAS